MHSFKKLLTSSGSKFALLNSATFKKLLTIKAHFLHL